MKNVFFVRHAKSSWADIDLKDHDRPLNSRGKKDAPQMAAFLIKEGIKVDGILTSSAKRAQQTAKVFAEAYGLSKNEVIKEKKLYHAGPKTIERCVRTLPDKWKNVLVFGHNPGYTEVANNLKNDDYVGNVPTCGVIGSKSDAKKWEKWKMSDARRTAVYSPKKDT